MSSKLDRISMKNLHREILNKIRTVQEDQTMMSVKIISLNRQIQRLSMGFFFVGFLLLLFFFWLWLSNSENSKNKLHM